MMKEMKRKQGTHRDHLRPDGEKRKTYVAPAMRCEGRLNEQTGLLAASSVGAPASPAAMPGAPTRP